MSRVWAEKWFWNRFPPGLALCSRAVTTRTTPWPAGVPCWTDLSTPDLDAAQAFYGAVLGWDFERPAGAEYGGYVIAQVRGSAAAGLGPIQSPGMPAAWTLYIASDDVERTASAIAEHGGTIVLPPGQVGPMGSLLVGLDPTGAPFGVWQAGEHIGAGIANEPGGLIWEDLRSPDPDRAASFYAGVFGWETQPLPEGGADYRMFSLGGTEVPLGGMGGMGGRDDLPPHWLVYFAVADVAAALAAVEARGGTVLRRDVETPYGRMAAVSDPAGAVFWIIENDGTGSPDRAD
jgi:predicted enzyme related to lactoylglutathione lyase